MKKDSVIIDEKVAKEHLKPVFNFALFCFIATLVFAALDIVFSSLSNNWFDLSSIIFMIVGALCLFGGIFFLLNYIKGINLTKKHVTKMDYEFFDDHISYVSSRDDRVVQQGDIPFTALASYRETKSYIFLGLSNNSFLTFNKSEDIISFVNEKGLAKVKTITVNRKK